MILCSLTLLLSVCGGSDGDNKYMGVSDAAIFLVDATNPVNIYIMYLSI